MSMSGRTQYFALKTYQLGDTVNFMPDFNDDMTTIDAQMHDNQRTGLSNSQQLETQQQAMTNMQNEIDEINAGLNAINKTTILTVSGNMQNLSSVNYFLVYNHNNLEFVIHTDCTLSKKDSEMPVVVTANSTRIAPMFSVPGNIFGLANGATNYKTISRAFGYTVITSDGAPNEYPLQLATWYDGASTQFGILLQGSPNDNFIYYNVTVECSVLKEWVENL